MKNLKRLLSERVLAHIPDLYEITEVRLRRDKPLVYARQGLYNTADILVRDGDIDHALSIASENSYYAVQDAVINGYLSYYGGIRIGVCGEGVIDNGGVKAIKNINSLIIRVPHEVKNIATDINGIIKNFENTIIISPPGVGKTTLLREMARRLSNRGEQVMIIDERYEITASVDGKFMLDVGLNTDAVVNVNKMVAYKSAVRAANPTIIVTDEIFGEQECAALADCVRCGVKVLASIHGSGMSVFDSIPNLSKIFKIAIILSNIPSVGSISDIVYIEQRGLS